MQARSPQEAGLFFGWTPGGTVAGQSDEKKVPAMAGRDLRGEVDLALRRDGVNRAAIAGGVAADEGRSVEHDFPAVEEQAADGT